MTGLAVGTRLSGNRTIIGALRVKCSNSAVSPLLGGKVPDMIRVRARILTALQMLRCP